MMPTMQEIDEIELTGFLADEQLTRLCAAARRGVEADKDEQGLLADIARLGAECDAARSELAALKVERDEAVLRERELASECVEAWENAVDWAGYASEDFREKWGYAADVAALDNAVQRLNALRARNQGDSNER